MSNQGIRLPRTDKCQPRCGNVNMALLHAFARLFCPKAAGNVCSVFKDNLANFFLKDFKVLTKRFRCENVTGLGLIVFAYYQLSR